MIRIGVDATNWHNTRGYGRHIRALLCTLIELDKENHYTFFFDSNEDPEDLSDRAEIRNVRTTTPTVLAASAHGHRSILDICRMSYAMSTGRHDLLLFPTIYSYVPVISPAKKIVFIHDIIPEAFPEYTLPSLKSRLFWKIKSTLGRWQADAIVTVSEFSRNAIQKYFNIPAARVFVVGEASDPVFRTLDISAPTNNLQSLGIDRENRLVTYVGGFGPHKNLEMLVEVFARIIHRYEFADVKLVMVGEYRKEVFYSNIEALKRSIVELDIHDRVVFTGYLADDDLVALLNVSTVLVLPSLMEGFGLPAIEAAACGCPVVATISSPLPDLLDGGGIWIDPNDRDQLEIAMSYILSSKHLRMQLGEAGLKAARMLTWKKAACQMMEVFQEVIVR